jgi:hypothetical protein
MMVMVEENSCRASPSRRRKEEGERVAARVVRGGNVVGHLSPLYIEGGSARVAPLGPTPSRAGAWEGEEENSPRQVRLLNFGI